MSKFKLTLCLLTACSFADADDDLYSKQYATCMDESDGVTIDMRSCIGEEYLVQDAKLNFAYKKLSAQLTAGRKQQLVTAQRLWIQYRDANCEFYADPEGGTLATINSATCGLDETARRAKELEDVGE